MEKGTNSIFMRKYSTEASKSRLIMKDQLEPKRNQKCRFTSSNLAYLKHSF